MRPRYFILLVLVFVLTASVFAQQDDDDVQSWNDVQITIPISKKVDLTLVTTARIGQNLSRLNEARIAPGFVFKPTKAFSIAPSYTAIVSRNSAGQFRDEHRFSVRGTYKFPTKPIGVSHRSTYEYRVRTSGNSWRYRAAIVLERDLPKKFLADSKIFAIEEVFYVSTTKRFSRNRFSIGISKKLDKRLTLDVYYLRQNDGRTFQGDVNVIGATWRINL